jgi:DNA-binding FadR family transcriptional regulator
MPPREFKSWAVRSSAARVSSTVVSLNARSLSCTVLSGRTRCSTLSIRIASRRIDDAEALSRSNRAFHRRLTLASHNRYLIAQVDHMKHFLLLLSGNTFVDQKRREAAVDEHAQIVAAIAARDMDAAEAAGRDHIRAAHKVRLQTMG